MAVHEDLPTAYHQQDTNYYCGAACAQMVLDQLGAGLLDQDGLYNDNHSHNVIEPSWYTAPDGLQWTLNNRKPSGASNYFALYALANEDAISRKIAWTIHHYHVAPVALVYGWQHWIVVRGYSASAAPASSDDASYAVTSFDVNNPWPPTPSTPPPPPHGGTDGCGAGGDRGVADENIAYATWQSIYMTGVPEGYWQGKFVAVCDPEPPPNRIGKQPPTPPRTNGDRLLTPKEAITRAIAGLKHHGLDQRESWKRLLTKAKAGEPSLVQRLDLPDSFYYIVPFQVGRTVPVLVCVDARYGDYMQSVVLPERGGNLLANLDFDPAAVLGRIVGKTFPLSKRRGTLVVRKEAFCLYPTLVWRPCQESLSAYLPFFMVTVGNDRLWIRVDGQVFTRLHFNKRGI